MNYYQNNYRHFDDVLAELRKITLMTDAEIIDFVQSNVISYEGLKNFYLKKARLPTVIECVVVNRGLMYLL